MELRDQCFLSCLVKLPKVWLIQSITKKNIKFGKNLYKWLLSEQLRDFLDFFKLWILRCLLILLLTKLEWNTFKQYLKKIPHGLIQITQMNCLPKLWKNVIWFTEELVRKLVNYMELFNSFFWVISLPFFWVGNLLLF